MSLTRTWGEDCFSGTPIAAAIAAFSLVPITKSNPVDRRHLLGLQLGVAARHHHDRLRPARSVRRMSCLHSRSARARDAARVDHRDVRRETESTGVYPRSTNCFPSAEVSAKLSLHPSVASAIVGMVRIVKRAARPADSSFGFDCRVQFSVGSTCRPRERFRDCGRIADRRRGEAMLRHVVFDDLTLPLQELDRGEDDFLGVLVELHDLQRERVPHLELVAMFFTWVVESWDTGTKPSTPRGAPRSPLFR